VRSCDVRSHALSCSSELSTMCDLCADFQCCWVSLVVVGSGRFSVTHSRDSNPSFDLFSISELASSSSVRWKGSVSSSKNDVP